MKSIIKRIRENRFIQILLFQLGRFLMAGKSLVVKIVSFEYGAFFKMTFKKVFQFSKLALKKMQFWKWNWRKFFKQFAYCVRHPKQVWQVLVEDKPQKIWKLTIFFSKKVLWYLRFWKWDFKFFFNNFIFCIKNPKKVWHLIKVKTKRLARWSWATLPRRMVATVLIALTIFLPISNIFLANKAQAAWWDDSWMYRKPITIANSSGGTLTDYQVKILDNANLTTLVGAGKVQASLNDLRFTDASGNLLSFWVEDATNSAVKAWVKIPSLTTAGATVYMYYGKETASSASDGNNTFTFFDDFDDASIDTGKWNIVNATGWSETGGTLHGTSTTGRIQSIPTFSAPFQMATRHKTTTFPTNGYETLGTFLSTSNAFGGFRPQSNTVGYTRYDSTWSGSFNPSPVTFTAYHTARIWADASNNAYARLEQDANSWQANYTNTISNEPITLGERYDNANTGQTYSGDWDWIFVRKYSAVEPVTSVPGNEEKGVAPSAYWKFDEGTGILANDSISNINNGSATTITQTYPTAGTFTWTAPAGITSATVKLWGGGGGGGGASYPDFRRAGGGAGGQFAQKMVTVSPGTGYTVVIGSTALGGSGVGVSQTPQDGTIGADSTFNSNTVVAKGGAAGTKYNGGSAAGSIVGGVGDTVYAGGTGRGGDSSYTGGGGGGAGTTGAGGDANPSGVYGGTGTTIGGGNGADGPTSDNPGGNGLSYGGGGSGARANGVTYNNGGTGAQGYAEISYSFKNTLTDMASPATSTSGWQNGTSCVNGKCLAFDGANDFVDINTGFFPLDSSARTISMWVNPASVSIDNMGLFGYGTESASQSFYLSTCSGADANKIKIGKYGTDASCSTGTISANVWQHISATLDGSGNVTYYINGKNAGTTTLSGVNTVLSAGYIGKASSSGTTFNGKIDEVKVYSYVRTSNQQKIDYNRNSTVLMGSGLGADDTTWWNKDWRYRKSIAVTNSSGGDLTDYQMKILSNVDLSADVSSGKIQSDLDDLRFTDADGNFLPYWIEEGSTNNSVTIWLSISIIPTAGMTVYMYYGNASVFSAQSGNDVFPFFDDFDGVTIDTSKWNIVNATGWSEVGGNLHGTNTTGRLQSTYNVSAPFQAAARHKITSFATNGHETLGTFLSTSDAFGGFRPQSNTVGYTRYDSTWSASFNPSPVTFTAYHTARIWTDASNNAYARLEQGANSWQAGYTNTISNEPITLGWRYDNANNGQTYNADWDWIFVRKYSATEPVAGTPGTEENSSSPVAYWKFDEGTGILANDSISNINNGSATTITQTYPTAGTFTWTAPAGITSATVKLWGGGGSGGGDASSTYGSGGGAGGQFSQKIVSVNPGTGYSVVVGALVSGGVGGANGNNGNDSSFNGTAVVAKGGAPGTYANPGLGGIGSTINGVGDIVYAGGNGSSGVTGSYSGAGGGGAGTTGGGGNASTYTGGTGTSLSGGNGGAGRNGTSGDGNPGADYGGGGGAAASIGTTYTGGAGAQGYAEISYSYKNSLLTNMASPATSTSGWQNGTSCVNGKCLAFDGANDFVDLSAGFFPSASSARTISMWVNPASVSIDNMGLFGYGTESASQSFYLSTCSGADANKIKIGKYGTDASCSTGTISANVWQHISATLDGSGNVTYYINGKNAGTATLSGVNTVLSAGYIGKASSSGTTFNGKIDEVRVYSYSMNASQVSTEVNLSASLSSSTQIGANLSAGTASEYCVPGDASSCNSPIGEWKMDENTGTTANDTSGNNNTGTLTGGPTWVPGKYGSGVNFVGTSSNYINQANSISGVKTVSFWAKPSNTSQSFLQLASGVSVTSSAGTVSAGGFTAPTIYVNGVVSGAVSANTWNYITVTTGTSVTSNAIKFGLVGSTYYTGALDQIRLYDYARTPAQIAWEYNRGGPVAWWKMDECTGSTIYDASGNGNNGTLTVGATGSQSSIGTCTTASTAWGNGATGKFGSSLKFDGTDDYVDQATSISGIQTVSFWAKPSTTSQSFLQLASGVSMTASSGTITAGGFSSPTIYVNGVLGGIVSADSWNYVVVTTETGVTANAIKMGLIGSTYYSGQIDDIRLYNYVLTEKQIATLMNDNSALRFGR